MSEIKAEKGIPIPRVSKHPMKYPWNEMEVGDSFIATTSTRQSTWWANLRFAPKRFISRTVDENGKPSIRIWRIE